MAPLLLLEIIVGDTVLLLELLDILLLLLSVELLGHLAVLVVENDDVSIADVEARQMLARVLGVKDVLVHDERRAFGVARVASVSRKHKQVSSSVRSLALYRSLQLDDGDRYVQSNLSNGSELAKDIVHLLGRDLERQVTHVQDAIDFGRQARLHHHRHRHQREEIREGRGEIRRTALRPVAPRWSAAMAMVGE